MKFGCSQHVKNLMLTSLVFVSTSCATIFSGANQNIKVKSLPEGGSVYINGKNMYRHTPCRVKIKRRQKPTEYNKRNELNIEVKKDGYQDARLNVQGSFNILSGASIAMAGVPFLIDWAAGANIRYNKANYLYLDPIEAQPIELKNAPEAMKPKSKIEISFVSDIDYNIPVTAKTNENRFALIIGNEDYASFQSDLSKNANVKFARNDATSFKEYAIDMLGIPEDNITFLTDATLAKMKKGLVKMNLLAKNSNGQAELFFYYAGHGLPGEKNKEPYLIPVDVSGKDIDFAIGLSEAFKYFTQYETQKITCFLDCCFSGGSREEPIYESRGVKIVPKQASITGNMVVFAASSADQSAMAYDDQQHGLFTYYLLKKFKDSKGELTYGELEQYIQKNLPIQSLIINDKEQLPQVNIGNNIDKDWEAWEF